MKQLNLLYRGEECLSTNSAFLIGPAVFCCQRLHRSFRSIEDEDLSSRTAVGKFGSTDGQSQKFVNVRHTTTSRQERQRVIIYCEISTLVPFISIACLLFIYVRC